MRVRPTLIAAILCVALAVSVGATGCSRSTRSNADSTPAPDGAITVTRTVEPTASGEPTAPADATPQDSSTPPADADAVLRELDAIERELGGMDLPSETDFDSLEGDVR